MELKDYDPWRAVGGPNTYTRQAQSRTKKVNEPDWQPVMDAFHTDTEMVLLYEIPGVLSGDIDVRVDGRVMYVRGVRRAPADAAPPELTMRAERTFGTFDRSIALPAGTDPNGVRATYRYGVLEIRVPHARRPAPRDVPVEDLEAGGTTIEITADTPEHDP